MSDDTKTDATEKKVHDGNDGNCECGHCGPATELAEKLLEVCKLQNEGKYTDDRDRMSVELDAAAKLLAAFVVEFGGNVNIIIARLLWRIDINERVKQDRQARQFMEFMKSAQVELVGDVRGGEDEDDDEKKPVTVN